MHLQMSKSTRSKRFCMASPNPERPAAIMSISDNDRLPPFTFHAIYYVTFLKIHNFRNLNSAEEETDYKLTCTYHSNLPIGANSDLSERDLLYSVKSPQNSIQFRKDGLQIIQSHFVMPRY